MKGTGLELRHKVDSARHGKSALCPRTSVGKHESRGHGRIAIGRGISEAFLGALPCQG